MKVPESTEDVHAALGLPPGWRPTTAEEAEFFYKQALDLFRAPTASGFHCVTKSGKQWQAKRRSRCAARRKYSAGTFGRGKLPPT